MRVMKITNPGRRVTRKADLEDQRTGNVGRRDIRQGTASPIDFTPKGVRASVVRINLPKR